MTRTSGLAQFGLEFLLAFMLVLTYLRVTDTEPGDQAQVGRESGQKLLGVSYYLLRVQGAGQDSAQVTPALSVGVAYTAALTAHRGTLNPALALGQVSLHTKHRAAVAVANVVAVAGLRAHHQLPVHAAVDLLAGARAGRGVRSALPGGDRGH